MIPQKRLLKVELTNADKHMHLSSMVRSTGTRLTKPQIMGCIRSIDADGDGSIDIPELYAAMEVVLYCLGVS
jgi:Ca2+-binding EF-hand superfamily protein